MENYFILYEYKKTTLSIVYFVVSKCNKIPGGGSYNISRTPPSLRVENILVCCIVYARVCIIIFSWYNHLNFSYIRKNKNMFETDYKVLQTIIYADAF